MGFNTSIMLLNDALTELKEDKDFHVRLHDAVLRLSAEKLIDVPVGNHVNGCVAVESHRADQLVPILMGGNYPKVIKVPYIRWDQSEVELLLAAKIAHKNGFKLVKKT